MNKTQGGFTLIELMITVVIFGVIASIAYPSYTENIRKSKRREAEAAMVSLANTLEMYKMQNSNSYTGATVGSGATDVFPSRLPLSGGTQTYTLSIALVAANPSATPPTPSSFTITATPIQADPTCGNLTLNNLGVQTPSTDGCW